MPCVKARKEDGGNGVGEGGYNEGRQGRRQGVGCGAATAEAFMLMKRM